MSMVGLDPRLNPDRVFDYMDYRRLRESHPVAKTLGMYRYIPPLRAQYKLGLGLGVLVLLASWLLTAFVTADAARLDYAQQEISANLGALEQAEAEAWGERVAQENELYAGAVVPAAEVVYPGRTRYLVLTNIPRATGKRLVAELYPLSRRIIRLEP
jgi:hypothetical protein